MSGAARQGQDSAGGTIVEGSGDVIINGTGAVRVGDAVAGHGLPPHDSPVMAEGSDSVFVNGLPLSRSGDLASCGDAATGSGDVIVG